jgi:hypothetical protein
VPIGCLYLKSAMLMMQCIHGLSSKTKRHYIVGYVIMPSHVHIVIAFSNTGKSINTIVSNGKRFIAYDLINRLQQQNIHLILNELSSTLNNTEIKEGKLHNVFEHLSIGKSAVQKNSFNRS